jgi:hypothetical protein
VTLALAQYGLRHGLDLEINWLGRIGVWLVMSAIVLALLADSWIIDLVFIVGLAFAVLATVVYVRTALGARRRAG